MVILKGEEDKAATSDDSNDAETTKEIEKVAKANKDWRDTFTDLWIEKLSELSKFYLRILFKYYM
mgnify:FL=1